MQFMVVGGIFLAVINIFFVGGTVAMISEEIYARVHYGEDWKARFEEKHGPLGEFNQFLGVMSCAAVTVPLLTVWLYKSVRNPNGASRKKKPGERRMGNTERVMRARSKALFWNYLGLLGIAIAALLILFRWGIFADHANEIILGMFVFVGGYCGIMNGCWWWLKAKAWTEALTIIGLWPLPILFIPYVRIVFIRLVASASPVLQILMMLLTPAILFVVVATLPDKSGVSSKERRPMNWKNIGQKR